MNTCIIESCDRQPLNRGLCAACYYKHRRAGTLESVALPSKQPTASKHIMSNVNPDTVSGTCSVCGDDTEAYQRANQPAWRCRNKKRTSDAKSSSSARPRRTYKYGDGIRIPTSEAREARDQLETIQDGRCAICDTVTVSLHLDHCHVNGTFRGLLCVSCNLGLGHFKDDPVRLAAAIEYLTR